MPQRKSHLHRRYTKAYQRLVVSEALRLINSGMSRDTAYQDLSRRAEAGRSTIGKWVREFVDVQPATGLTSLIPKDNLVRVCKMGQINVKQITKGYTRRKSEPLLTQRSTPITVTGDNIRLVTQQGKEIQLKGHNTIVVNNDSCFVSF